MFLAEVENAPTLPTGICQLFRHLSEYRWADAAQYCNALRSSGGPSDCQAAISFISPHLALCREQGCKPPESTVLHQLAHTHPGQRADDDWEHYHTILAFAGLACFCAPWIEIRNGNYKTPLQAAAATGNRPCMLMLFHCKAGH